MPTGDFPKGPDLPAFDPTKEQIEAAAEAIRTEIHILLSDYIVEAEILILDDDAATDEQKLAAQARVYALSWLLETWDGKSGASEERLHGAARAALGCRFLPSKGS